MPDKSTSEDIRLDIKKARAMGFYLRASGDIDETYVLMKKKIGKRTLKQWEKEHNWKLWHDQHQNELLRDVFEDETLRKRQSLRLLRDAKEAIVRSIKGTYDAEGLVIIPPIKARSLESSIEAMISCINTERAIHGDGDGDRKDDGEHLFSALLTAARDGRKNGNGNDKQIEQKNEHSNTEQDKADISSH